MNKTPHVLVLYSHNVGDRNQAETLAKLIGWPYQLHKIHPPKRPRMPKLAGAPPDIIIAVNKPCTELALQLKQQSQHPIKIIRLGSLYLAAPKPFIGARRLHDLVDLHIVYDQYKSFVDARIVRQELPFSMVDSSQFERFKSEFPQFECLPHPRFAVLVGGRNRYFQWTPEIAEALGRRINTAVESVGGSVMITTSYRTGAECTEALLAAIRVPHDVYRWDDATRQNPLNGYLAHADRIVVTMDSVAMVADGLNTGKPLSVYRLEPKKFVFLKLLMEWFMPVSGRTAIIKQLVRSGEVTWFNEGEAQPRQDYRSRYNAAVEAARNLLASGPAVRS